MPRNPLLDILTSRDRPRALQASSEGKVRTVSPSRNETILPSGRSTRWDLGSVMRIKYDRVKRRFRGPISANEKSTTNPEMTAPAAARIPGPDKANVSISTAASSGCGITHTTLRRCAALKRGRRCAVTEPNLVRRLVGTAKKFGNGRNA